MTTLKLVDNPDNPQNVEIVTYTGRTGATPNFTLTGVSRGISGTTAKKWRGGCFVESVADADVINNPNIAGAIDFELDNGILAVPVATYNSVAQTKAISYGGTIQSFLLKGDVPTNCVIDVLKNGAPILTWQKPILTSASSVSGSFSPTLAFTARDEFAIDVQSNSNATKLRLQLFTIRS